MKLKAGVHVGGIVVDPEGNPIADATVTLARFWAGDEEIKKRGEQPASIYQKQTTGADGRWTGRNLPSELLERIQVSASHGSYIGAVVTVGGKPEVERELRAGTFRLQLKRGLEARGRVINEQQQPIAGAQVWAAQRFFQDRQETKSDGEGRFIFRNLKEGKINFSVVAEGYAPENKPHDVRADAEEIVFQLTQGSVIRGKVQDPSGQPIEGVQVSLEGVPGQVSYETYEYSTETDSKGVFEWKGAPNSPVPFSFGKSGYEQKRKVELKPGEDNVITLRPNRQVKGQVLEAETEKPITQFKIAVGHYYAVNKFSSYSHNRKEFKNEEGRFTIEIYEEDQNEIQAAANDYAPEIQTIPPEEGGQITMVFKLKPSPSLTGTVVTADGQPVAGASVSVVDGIFGGRSARFSRGKLSALSSNTTLATTDASGRFSIPNPPANGTVLTANGTGFGSASIAEVKSSGVVMLQALGRIEGVLMQSSAAGVGQELLLNSPNGEIYFDFGTTKHITDAQGRFTFEDVPAGTVSIVRLVKISPKSSSFSHRTDVVVTPGQTTQVVLGGTDATLQGQVRFETTPPEEEYTVSAQLSPAAMQRWVGAKPEEWKAFLNSPEGKEQMKNQKYYTGVVGKDGALVLDSVAPGQYTLTVRAAKATEEFLGRNKPLAEGVITVTIPEGADPGSPIEVGEIVLRPPK